MRSICLIMLMLCIDAGIGAEANAQNFWNKVKKEVHKAVNNQSQRPQSPSRKPSESSTSAGFDLINKNDLTTKETKVSILYPGIQSCSDPCDGTYARLLANSRQIIRKIHNGNGGQYWSNYSDGKINRLIL